MKSSYLRVFLILPLFATVLAHAESTLEIESRCIVLKDQIQRHNENLKDGATVGNLYSLTFRFDAFRHVSKVEVPKETQEYVQKVRNTYEQMQADEGPKGAAKKEALLAGYKNMNTHLRKLFAEADALYPECQLIKSSTEVNKARVPEKKSAPANAQQ